MDGGPDAGPAANDAGPGVADAGPGLVDGGAPGSTVMLSIGPIAVAAGSEVVVCTHVRLPTNTDINVTEISAILAPGSHHLILYQDPNTTVEAPTPTPCQSLDISNGETPVFIAETEMNNTLPVPPGVAYQLTAGQMVKIEAHYINASSAGIMGQGNISLTVGPTGTYQAAGVMFCGSVSQLYVSGVPPGMVTLNPGWYAPPSGVQIFGLTTHEHSRGTLVTLAKSTGTSDMGTLLDDGTPYSNPPFVIYNAPNLLSFSSGEGIRWQCFYDNTTTETYYFGQSAATNEMCYWWGYYYPAAANFIGENQCWQ